MKNVVSFLREVLVETKYLLGGGSFLVILAGGIEHFTANNITWSIYVWLICGCFAIALIKHGAKQHARLQRKMSIHSPRSVWPISHYGFTGANWHFVVENLSEAETLEEARANIVSISPPLDYPLMPKPMKIKDENYDVRSFSINPTSYQGNRSSYWAK
jgi:hypothetical protein